MTAQELKQYEESLTVKELIEILENEETANLTEAKKRQSNVQKWIILQDGSIIMSTTGTFNTIDAINYTDSKELLPITKE